MPTNCHNLFLGYSPNLFSLQKNQKKLKLKKIIAMKKGCWSALKMARIWLRRFKNTKIEI